MDIKPCIVRFKIQTLESCDQENPVVAAESLTGEALQDKILQLRGRGLLELQNFMRETFNSEPEIENLSIYPGGDDCHYTFYIFYSTDKDCANAAVNGKNEILLEFIRRNTAEFTGGTSPKDIVVYIGSNEELNYVGLSHFGISRDHSERLDLLVATLLKKRKKF